MESLLMNSLLIGLYTLLSHSYSPRHTHAQRWVVGSVTLVARKNRREKIFCFSPRYCFALYFCVLLVFNKSLGTSALIGLLLSGVIQSSDSSCRSPTPSDVPTSSKSSLTSSATCKLSSLQQSGNSASHSCFVLFTAVLCCQCWSGPQ